MEAFILINGVGFLLLGVLCSFKPHFCLSLLGLECNGNRGLIEFTTVYGGLQIGLAGFYLYGLSCAQLHNILITFSAILYGAIVLARASSIFHYGSNKLGFIWVLLTVETAMLIWSGWLLW